MLPVTRDGWKGLVLQVVNMHDNGHPEPLDRLATILEEQERAKFELHLKGYGVTGSPLSDIIDEIPDARRGER